MAGGGTSEFKDDIIITHGNGIMLHGTNKLLSSQSMVTNGIILWLDATQRASYPGSGNTWYDLSPNAYELAFQGPGAPVYDPSIDGGVIEFNGMRDWWQLPSAEMMELRTSDFTYMVFFRMDSSNLGTGGAIVSKGGKINTAQRGYMFTGWDNNPRAQDVIGNSVQMFQTDPQPPIQPLPGYTFSVGCIRRNNKFLPITDGTVIDNTGQLVPVSYNISSPAQNFRVGRGNPMNDLSTNYFKGSISAILIYNRALNDDEIRHNYTVQSRKFT